MTPGRRRLAARRVLFPTGIAEGYVDVEGAVVVEAAKGPPPRDAVPVEDFGDALMTPALVDAHTHLALVALRGLAARLPAEASVVEDLFYTAESKLVPGDVRAFARMGAYDALLGGTGLVWDHYYAAEEVAAACADVGLTAVVAPTLQDEGGPGRGGAEAALAATETLATSARWRAAGIYAAAGPHATDTVSDALWERAVGLAERHGLPVHAHLAQSADEHARSLDTHAMTPAQRVERAGWMSRAPHVFAHALYVTRDELPALREATLVACPYSQLVFAFPARVDWWRAAQIRWVVATDCAASNDSMSLRKELRFLSGVGALRTSFGRDYERFFAGKLPAAALAPGRDVPAPGALLRRVLDAPGALHPAFRAGTLEVGALANVAVWDAGHPRLWPLLDPLRALTHGDGDDALRALFVRGQPVGETGDVAGSLRRSEAYGAHRDEAEKRLRGLLGRMGLSTDAIF
ncbi:MAG: amidohydrolase family protein [Myxococcota bacterium]